MATIYLKLNPFLFKAKASTIIKQQDKNYNGGFMSQEMQKKGIKDEMKSVKKYFRLFHEIEVKNKQEALLLAKAIAIKNWFERPLQTEMICLFISRRLFTSFHFTKKITSVEVRT